MSRQSVSKHRLATRRRTGLAKSSKGSAVRSRRMTRWPRPGSGTQVIGAWSQPSTYSQACMRLNGWSEARVLVAIRRNAPIDTQGSRHPSGSVERRREPAVGALVRRAGRIDRIQQDVRVDEHQRVSDPSRKSSASATFETSMVSRRSRWIGLYGLGARTNVHAPPDECQAHRHSPGGAAHVKSAMMSRPPAR